MDGFGAAEDSYRTLLAAIAEVDDVVGWQNTGCAGWTVRDLIFHLLADAQRALVALHTPAGGVADVDAVSYWSAWQPGAAGAEANRRGTRIMASAYSAVCSITASYSETALAVLVAGRKCSGCELVATQGHVLTVDALFSSLAVEATIHQLDLGLGEPSRAGLAHTRMVLDGLLGRNPPIEDAVRYARIGTGRAVLTDQEARSSAQTQAASPYSDEDRSPVSCACASWGAVVSGSPAADEGFERGIGAANGSPVRSPSQRRFVQTGLLGTVVGRSFGMSANFVDKTVIDLLLTAARKWSDGSEPWFYYWCRDGSHLVTAESVDAIGKMLWSANWDATEGWAYEDGDVVSPASSYRYDELPGVPDPAVVLRTISYYGYQTAGDEIEEWLLSEPSAFLDRLAHTAWAKLPGMQDLPWGVDESHRDIFVSQAR